MSSSKGLLPLGEGQEPTLFSEGTERELDILRELFDINKNLEAKTDLTANQILDYARAWWFIEYCCYGRKVNLDKLIAKVLTLSVSKKRKGRIEFKEAFNNIRVVTKSDKPNMV